MSLFGSASLLFSDTPALCSFVAAGACLPLSIGLLSNLALANLALAGWFPVDLVLAFLAFSELAFSELASPDLWRKKLLLRFSANTVSYTHLTLPTIYSV